MRWMLRPLKHYFDFAGRSPRREFWAFQLLPLGALLGVAIGLFRVLVAIGRAGEQSDHAVSDVAAYLEPAMGWFGFLLALLVIPGIAVQVRRLHDQDQPGVLVLLNLIPALGWLIVLILMCLPGTAGDNRYGPDPRETA